MRILVVGGKGTIGKGVVKELGARHEVAIVDRHGELSCDMANEGSIRALYEKAGAFDALVVCAGNVVFEDFAQMTSEKYEMGLKDKLMGQVNLVLIGAKHIRDGGSFTLISGILNRDPIRTGSSAAMVNGAIEGFVKGVAIELPRQIRINAVSPTVVTEAMDKYGPYFRGYESVPVSRVGLAYSKSVEGKQTGQVYEVI